MSDMIGLSGNEIGRSLTGLDYHYISAMGTIFCTGVKEMKFLRVFKIYFLIFEIINNIDTCILVKALIMSKLFNSKEPKKLQKIHFNYTFTQSFSFYINMLLFFAVI